MDFWEIILIIGCAALVIGVGIASIVRKKQGKSSCDCGCDCSHCNRCSRLQEEKDKK